MNKEEVFVGIDPGHNCSAVAVIDTKLNYIEHKYLEDWTLYDYLDYLRHLNDTYTIKLAAIEKVGVMKGQGISSSGKFMKATGKIIGMVATLEIPFVEVAPQSWKKIDPSLKGTKKDTKLQKKKKSLTYIRQRYPEANLKLEKDNDVADALCMALFIAER